MQNWPNLPVPPTLHLQYIQNINTDYSNYIYEVVFEAYHNHACKYGLPSCPIDFSSPSVLQPLRTGQKLHSILNIILKFCLRLSLSIVPLTYIMIDHYIHHFQCPAHHLWVHCSISGE